MLYIPGNRGFKKKGLPNKNQSLQRAEHDIMGYKCNDSSNNAACLIIYLLIDHLVESHIKEKKAKRLIKSQ